MTMTTELDRIILEKVNADGSIDTLQLSKELNKDHQLFVGAVKRLQSLGNVSFSMYCREQKH